MRQREDSQLAITAKNLFKLNSSLFAPLKILSCTFKQSNYIDKDRSDGLIIFLWQEQEFRFDLEVVGNLYIEAKIAALKKNIKNTERTLILVSYITEGIKEIIEKEGLNCIDLSGNFYFQTKRLLARVLDKPNQFKSFSRIRKVYSGNSSIIGRYLLARNDESSPGLLALRKEFDKRKGDIAISTISKVLSEMERDQIILKSEEGIKLLQPKKLLEKLADQYRPPKIIKSLKLKCPGDPISWLKDQESKSEIPWIRTGASSVNRYAVTVPDSVLSVYVPSLPSDPLPIDERFYNLVLNVTNDAFVYFDCDVENGWASQIQTYLELSQMDKREKEIAETIKTAILAKYE